VRLFTDTVNGQGARGLYEAFGFREAKQHIFYRKPFDFGSPTTSARA
jgi:ribosomal protein S18 acetylase RimI-like enzyme